MPKTLKELRQAGAAKPRRPWGSAKAHAESKLHVVGLASVPARRRPSGPEQRRRPKLGAQEDGRRGRPGRCRDWSEESDLAGRERRPCRVGQRALLASSSAAGASQRSSGSRFQDKPIDKLREPALRSRGPSAQIPHDRRFALARSLDRSRARQEFTFEPSNVSSSRYCAANPDRRTG